LAKLTAYRQKLERGGLSLAAHHLQAQLSASALDPLHDEPFLEYLLATKPLMIAESAVYGDGRDWIRKESSILGDVGGETVISFFGLMDDTPFNR
jgi:hypothetical protein